MNKHRKQRFVVVTDTKPGARVAGKVKTITSRAVLKRKDVRLCFGSFELMSRGAETQQELDHSLADAADYCGLSERAAKAVVCRYLERERPREQLAAVQLTHSAARVAFGLTRKGRKICAA